MQSTPEVVEDIDLLVTGAGVIATMDGGQELADSWIACRDGRIVAMGPTGAEPTARRTISAKGGVVTPGFINTHHHIFQNLTRSYRPATQKSLFGWLSTLYPLWANLDEEAVNIAALVGLGELALGGCTTSTDHLYIHTRNGGDLLGAEIAAAQAIGMRFHPTRGSMSVSVENGGLPPASVTQSDDEILTASEDAVRRFHDPSFGAMVKIALAPCSPFSVSPQLMRATAELAERLDVRLHTHLAEDPDEDTYCMDIHGVRPVDLFEDVGWLTNRSWVAHCVYPNTAEIERLGEAGVGIAHCPSSNMMIAGGGLAPVAEFLAAGSPVGLGCDGSSSTDSASLWLEARTAMLQGRLRGGPEAMGSREALEIATLGGAACLGRTGEIGVLRIGAVADIVCWPTDGIAFAGALSDPVEALFRCGPIGARHTVVNGNVIVEDGVLVGLDVEDALRRHRLASARLQHAVV